eukprot:COSAG01_NODE_1663_length_9574_cov_5.585646_1_plen_70_part_00
MEALETRKQGAGLRMRIGGDVPGWVSTKANDGSPILLPIKAPKQKATAVAADGGGVFGGSKGGMFGGAR